MNKSSKASLDKRQDLHKQLQRDLGLGLDYVSLLDIVANEPATGNGSDAWWHATTKSFASLNLLGPLLAGRIPENSPVGHWAWSVGAVTGGDETMRGAGAPILLRQSTQNPHTPQRAQVEALLAQLLGTLPQPHSWPVFIKDCKDCKRVHYFQEFSDVHQDCRPAD